MIARPLPQPVVARPLPALDPFRRPEAWRRVLSDLYHLEAGALDGFRMLGDPAFVQHGELFLTASQALIRDELAHLDDIRAMVIQLGMDPEIAPPHPALSAFLTDWRTGQVIALPLPAPVAAMFCLFSEGMGYAFLYNLAHATLDPEIREMLLSNVRDEQNHLRISMSILERALAAERASASDFAAYALGYALLARKAVRAQAVAVEEIGLDIDVIMGSSLRFLRDLVVLVLEGAGRRAEARLVGSGALDPLFAPPAMAALRAGMALPEPPLARRAAFVWGRLNQRRRRDAGARAA